MTIVKLELPERKIMRAQIIKEYLKKTGTRGVVCLSCGNASRALKEVGLSVVDVSETGVLLPTRWLTTYEVKFIWPDLFDATSGHLTVDLMHSIGLFIADSLNLDPSVVYAVPSGSGETLESLKLARPECNFRPVYDISRATEYHHQAPLNSLVNLLSS